ncbi:hypothetical protein WA026_010538 [Henosepilachna vigintioctopunctata]|uniref:CUB domain-containing protein n=1 Tax=Henosepilachna vigintioctopunctata TaxID=420089 RepID=A0AAW1VCH2_9CUCU
MTTGERGCGQVFKQSRGVIYSAISRYSGPYCFFQIELKKQLKTKLMFILLSTDDSPGCTKEYVEIFEGYNTTSPSIGRYCGKTTPAPYISASNVILIKFKRTDLSAKFILKYEVACGGTFESPSGIIQSEGYPNHYAGDLSCVYVIRQPKGSAISLQIQDLDLEDYDYGDEAYDTDCTYDYLEVRDGDNERATLIGSYCSVPDGGPIMSSSNNLWLKFVSDYADGGKGFKANYSSTFNLGCGGVVTNKTGIISFESQKWSTKRCRWILEAPIGFVIKIVWITFNIASTHDCNKDVVNVYENDSDSKNAVLIGSYCGNKLPPVILTSTNVATVRATLTASKEMYEFIAHYNFINESSVCGGNYFTSSGVIKSPGYPKSYPKNSECVWIITVPPGQKIRLQTETFVSQGLCRFQYVEIRNGGSVFSPLIDRYCSSRIPKVILSHTNQLYIHIISRWFLSTYSKFMFSWTSTTSGCGGTLISSSGGITSPNYPEPYNPTTECSWSIIVNPGSVIQLIFMDLDLESLLGNRACSFDYVQVFDGISERSKSLGTFCKKPLPTYIQTSQNQADVYFKSDHSFQGRGFNMKYRSVCSNKLTGYGGVIESPNYPEPNSFAEDCYWNITVSRNNKINITFSDFDLRQKNDFSIHHINMGYYQRLGQQIKQENYLEIKYPKQNEYGETEYVQVVRYNSTSKPDLITIPSDRAVIRFKSNTNIIGKGFRLEWIIYGCGSHIKKAGSITSPNYPQQYPNDIECEWLIEAPIGHSIIINFTFVDVEKDDTCVYDSIKVFNGPDSTYPMLGHLCHIDKPVQYSGNGHLMKVHFMSDASFSGKGFVANVQFVRSKCGGKMTAISGTITTPNYPRNFDSGDICEWLIITDENHVIDFEFVDMDLISATNCVLNYVKIYDGSNTESPLLARVCDGTAPNITYTSTSNEMLIIFNSTSRITSLGFKANYYKACGALIQAKETSGNLRWRHFSFYTTERNQNCTWTIVAPNPDQHVSLTITHLHMDTYSNEFTGVSIYNGKSSNSSLIDNYRESKLPPTIVSDGVALHVVVDRHVNFFATYEIFGSNCGGRLSGLNGMFSTPGYPKSYPFSIACEWSIQISPGNEVNLAFQKFDIPSSPQCNEDFLEIRKTSGTGVLLGIFCGEKKPVNITHQGSLWIYFKTSRTINDSISLSTPSGFLAEYTMSTSVQLKGFAGEIASPFYPEGISGTETFAWTISARNRNARLLLQFKEFRTESFDDNDCYNNYISVYDGENENSPKLGSYCGLTKPAPIESSSNTLHIVSSMLSNRLPNLFYLRWSQIYYAKRTTPSKSCGSNGVIDISELHRYNFSSPGYPYGYSPRLRCEWSFQTNPLYNLGINFTDLSLGSSHGCYFDYVEIFSKNSRIKTVCNRRHTNILYNTSNVMRVVFSTNAYWNGTGFNAIVSERCGGMLTGPSGTIIFNEHTPRDTACVWTITARSGRTVELKFSQFHSSSNRQCSNYITIKNGLYSSSPNLGSGRYCYIPPTLQTTSNNLYLEFSGNPNRTSFKASYREISYECGGVLTLDEETPSAVISSPNYPNKSRPFVECFWVIKSTPGTHIQLDFFNLFEFHGNTECSTEAVELRDGGTALSPVIGKFCEKPPGSQFSADNTLFVKFFTEEKDPGRGFSANVTIASCGGTYKEQSGEINWSWDSKHRLISNNCSWHIIVPSFASLTMKISFKNFQLNLYSCMTNGEFAIYEVVRNPTYKKKRLADMCDSKTHKTITSVSNHVIIEFTNIMKLRKFSVSPSSFSVIYNATKTECTYTETSDFGTIQSPGYPGLNYLVALCSWFITVRDGRRITINITDFDLEKYSQRRNGTGQYLAFYDYGDYLLETLPYNSNKRLIKSSGNKVQVLFSCGQSTNHRGFSADYSSNEETVCTDDISGLRGTISRNKEVRYNCIYQNIQLEPINRTFVLTVQSSIVYKIKYEERSYIDILVDHYKTGETLFSTNKATLKPVIVRNALPETFLKIRMAGMDANFTINYEYHPCGGIIKGERGSFTSPGYPTKYKKHLECAWVIHLPEEHQIKLNFVSLNLGDDCEKSYITIYNGKYSTSPRIGRFCNTNKPEVIISQRNYLLIEYHYETSSSAVGFNATYEPVIKGCGGTFSDNYRMIETPNYPKDYPNNAECRWTIVVDEGFHLEFKYTGRFHLEESNGCKNDYVEVFDWKNQKWVTFGKRCGRNVTTYKSSGNKLLVIFRSNERISGVGFQAEWKKKCGGVFLTSSDKKYIISPGYPYQYGNNLRCKYEIYGIETYVVEFEDFALEGEYPTCTNDKVEIYSLLARSGRRGNEVYCGSAKPVKYRTRYRSTITLSTDSAVGDRGFKFSIKTDGCGETITSPKVINVKSTTSHPPSSYRPIMRNRFTFQRYGLFYSPYAPYMENCLWNITAPEGKVIVMKFTQFSSTPSVTCFFNSLEVYDGVKREYRNLLARLCGKLEDELPILTSTNNSALLYLKQMGSSSTPSFSVDIGFAPGPSEGCGGTFNLTTSKVIKPPKNMSNLDCHWKFSVAENYRIEFQFRSLNLPTKCNENRLHGSKNCTCSFVEVRDGLGPFSELVDQLCGTLQNYTGKFQTSWKFGFLRFYSTANSTDAFEVRVMPVLDFCGPHVYTATKAIQTLTSPGFPGPYPTNIKCMWTIKKNTYFENLVLRFVEFDLTHRSENSTANVCTNDRVEVDETDRNSVYRGIGNVVFPQKQLKMYTFLSRNKEVLQFCGKESKPFDIFSGTYSINVGFTSTNEVSKGNGFKLDFFLSGCGYNYTQDYGRIVIRDKDIESYCSVYITSAINSTISLYFNNYWYFTANNSCSGSVEVYDGHTKDSPLLMKHCGSGNPTPVFSNSNKMWINVTRTNKRLNLYSKIDATFISTTRGKGCGGKIFDKTGIITSPMYPKNYTSDSTCVWKIQGPFGVKMSISFRIFDISASCDVNYLKIATYSEGKANERTFCKKDYISTLVSEGKAVITYKSSVQNTGKGWLLSFRTTTINNFS